MRNDSVAGTYFYEPAILFLPADLQLQATHWASFAFRGASESPGVEFLAAAGMQPAGTRSAASSYFKGTVVWVCLAFVVDIR